MVRQELGFLKYSRTSPSMRMTLLLSIHVILSSLNDPFLMKQVGKRHATEAHSCVRQKLSSGITLSEMGGVIHGLLILVNVNKFVHAQYEMTKVADSQLLSIGISTTHFGLGLDELIHGLYFAGRRRPR